MDIDINMINQIVVNSNKALEKAQKKSFKGIKKDYYDEYLTGLTEDEKKEIQKRVEAYIKDKKLDLNNKADLDNLKNYIESLLKEFGYKGDIEEMADSVAFNAIFDKETNTEVDAPNDSLAEIQNAYKNSLNNHFKVTMFKNQFA